MREILLQMIEQSGSLTVRDIMTNISFATFLSLAVYVSYWYTHVGTAYSKKFNVSLVTLTILTSTVMTVIGNNIALSLGMVGALSIVRFRTAIKDSRDTTYIFWAIIIGISTGAGDYLVASFGSAVVFVVLLFLGRVKNENRILLIIRGNRVKELEIESAVYTYFQHKAFLRVKNTTQDSIELIYELSRKVYQTSTKNNKTISERIYEIGEVDYVNIITQNDEIS
ncbi:MAG TPA: DUF4956 domain-containing protein [Proteiniclasticum sp.]|uniref:DUF4956 domain-containing protein n=1 Tax=Proteiniclasticum ruminis TaxID=398199 RepID=A0A1I5CI29_9CLOT|nr:protein of unknown function [Proteiniclasticum ruminis]HBW14037.1 DUF4956 domain-containing protein [Proteiniclasticum sp.]